MRFEGKRVIVTGGATGIGRATAIAFAREGALVMIGDVDARARETVAEIEALGRTADFQPCDVSSSDDANRLVQACLDRFGGLEIGFNNAGVFPHKLEPLHEISDADFDGIFAVNVRGVFNMMRAEIRHFRAAGGGAIVNTGSVGSVIADPGMAAYVSSKHAVLGLTRAAGLENARYNIRVNAVGPGMVRTPMTARWLDDPAHSERVVANHPMGRPAEPEEIANLVLFLASDSASFMNAQIHMIDGGATAH